MIGILFGMLTFSDIYEAMRKEKYSENLQMLPEKFLVDASEYFREKKEFLKKEDDLFSDMAIKNKKNELMTVKRNNP